MARQCNEYQQGRSHEDGLIAPSLEEVTLDILSADAARRYGLSYESILMVFVHSIPI